MISAENNAKEFEKEWNKSNMTSMLVNRETTGEYVVSLDDDGQTPATLFQDRKPSLHD